MELVSDVKYTNLFIQSTAILKRKRSVHIPEIFTKQKPYEATMIATHRLNSIWSVLRLESHSAETWSTQSPVTIDVVHDHLRVSESFQIIVQISYPDGARVRHVHVGWGRTPEQLLVPENVAGCLNGFQEITSKIYIVIVIHLVHF